MNINIRTIPHAEHRYDTAGDYWWTLGGDLEIRVSDLGDWRKELLIAVHELIEATLCEHRGIAEPDIMAFDMSIPNHPDPGSHPDAPYAKEHFFAECIERLLCAELGLRWQDYDTTFEGLEWPGS